MTRVEEIEQAIQELGPVELRQLRQWFAEYDQEVWDNKLQEDVASGKLDTLAEQAIRAHRKGNTRKL